MEGTSGQSSGGWSTRVGKGQVVREQVEFTIRGGAKQTKVLGVPRGGCGWYRIKVTAHYSNTIHEGGWLMDVDLKHLDK